MDGNAHIRGSVSNFLNFPGPIALSPEGGGAAVYLFGAADGLIMEAIAGEVDSKTATSSCLSHVQEELFVRETNLTESAFSAGGGLEPKEGKSPSGVLCTVPKDRIIDAGKQ